MQQKIQKALNHNIMTKADKMLLTATSVPNYTCPPAAQCNTHLHLNTINVTSFKVTKVLAYQ